MIIIEIPSQEMYDDEKNDFYDIPATKIRLEHSLLAISKWEALTHKSFFYEDQKTTDEWYKYIKCMMIDDDIPEEYVYAISPEDMERIHAYVDDPYTATTFSNLEKKHGPKKKITNEQIYYWMTKFNIPFSCDTWHLNHLMTLIIVCGESENPKKMSRKDIYKQYGNISAAYRARMAKQRGKVPKV